MGESEQRMQLPCSQMTPAATGGGSGKRRTRRRKAQNGEAEDARKRRLSDEQVKFLETSFQDERKLESGRKSHLAAELGMDPKQVAVWFQNRRARHKSKQVEDAFAQLKVAHDAVVLEKCNLEHQVLALKGKLVEAEEEIRRLTLGLGGINGGTSGSNANGGGGSSSPSSSFSAVSQQAFVGEAELIYMREYDDFNYMMEWANLYEV